MTHEKKKEIVRVVKFALISASAGIIQLVSVTLLLEVAGLRYMWSYLISLVLSVLWNFTINRKFTFKSANNVPIAMLKVAAFYCVFTPVTTLLGNYLVETQHWNEYVVQIINMALNLTTEYLYDRFFVFKNTIDTNNIAKKTNEK